MAFMSLRVRTSRLPCCFAGAYRGPIVCFHSTVASEEKIKPLDAIPGPVRLPIIGTIWQFLLGGLLPGAKPFGKRVLDRQFQRHKQYGVIYRTQDANRHIVRLADPHDVETVFRSETKFPTRFDSPVLEHYRKTHKRDPGVFFANYDQWYKHRSVISKRILRPKEVAEYVAPFNQIISEFITRLREIREVPDTEREFEIAHLDNELFKWSFESVAEVLFDRRFGCLKSEVNKQAQEFINTIGVFLGNSIAVAIVPISFYKIYKTRRYKDFISSFDKLYELAEVFIGEKMKEIEENELTQTLGDDSDGERKGFLEFLLSSGRMTKDDLLASVIDLLFAGVDTTSSTVQWALYQLAKNPDKQAKLYEEVNSVLKGGIQPDGNALSRMPYLKACIRETLRLYPVLSSLSRKLQHDVVLSGYRIPANTQVQFSMYYMGRSEELFPDATSFKPERWLREGRSVQSEAFSAFASIPFGFGTRMCIGRRIAELEIHLLLARIVQEFQLGCRQDEEVEPLARGLTIPDRAVRVTFEDRQA